MILNLASLVCAALLGLYAKQGYQGPAAEWVHDSFGGVIYVIVWCLAAALVVRHARASRIAVIVLAATCCLEFLQLWHPPLLEAARATFLGHAVLGSYFDWNDFPYYFAGAALGWAWLRVLGRR